MLYEVMRTPLYGEGFQMLAQTMGSWQFPQSVGRCPDSSVYRITDDDGYHTVHNLLLVEHDKGWLLLAFASCHRFGGEFRLYPDGRLQILMNCEDRLLSAGQHWQSEALICLEGADREALLAELAERIAAEHGSLIGQVGERPNGWCSWYHYYTDVSADDIRENLAVRAERFPALRYVQIDDGYQAKMGDWLTPSPKFEQGVAALAAASTTPPPPGWKPIVVGWRLSCAGRVRGLSCLAATRQSGRAWDWYTACG